VPEIHLGPDASRYWIAAQGRPVARPFHLRWLLPAACGTSPRRWWSAWALSWPVLGVGTFLLAAHLGWQRALFAAVVTLALPGVWGPKVVRPVGVDLPAMALGAVSAAAAVHGWLWLAVVAACVGAMVKESTPIFAALWAWSAWPLVGLVAIVIPLAMARPAIDEVTAQPHLRRIHDHPIRTAIEYRRGYWRSGWVMVAPWGATLAALIAPTPQLVAVLVVAHLQLLVATDTVRLVHAAAGPAVAVAAAQVFPTAWLPLVAVLHAFWFWEQKVI
jgi:hypothetical protein